ncbi:MAG: hypothetical protein Q4D38_07685 [Planctomycetia bacterium]|nr:hypothetical protein [Planctomycetia bacterium]
MQNKIRFSILAALALVPLLVGCGDGRPPMVEVKGKVTHKGAPLKFGSVFFTPTSSSAVDTPVGVIQDDGTFEMQVKLRNSKVWKGAPLGEYKVSITCFESQNPNYKPPTDAEPMVGKSLIPQKYTQPDESGLTVVVKEGMEPLTFDLE